MTPEDIIAILKIENAELKAVIIELRKQLDNKRD